MIECAEQSSHQMTSSVTCMCSQPVTHAVSLDYVQSTVGEEQWKENDDPSLCTNPCGCANDSHLQGKSLKLQPWAKALIGVAVAIVASVFIVLLALVVLIIVRRVFFKRSFSRRIAKRVTLRDVDSPVMAIKFCLWWLC